MNARGKSDHAMITDREQWLAQVTEERAYRLDGEAGAGA
jgi:hypothetical protein